MILTDDWKNGNLECSEFYYVKTNLNPSIRVDCFCYHHLENNVVHCGFKEYNDNIIEVLAPCDYEELQRLRKLTAKLLENGDRASEIIQQRCKEIEQLHQLLKESKNALEWYAQCKCSKSMIDKEGIIFEFADKANKALTRINEVLK